MREMKDSGVEWIGEIPSDWIIERIQWHMTEVKESNNPIQTKKVLSLTNKLGVVPYEEKGNQGNVSKENYDEYKLAYPDTIVANSMNILIGSVGICNYFGCVSPVYYVFKPNDGENLEYLNYIFQSEGFQKELRKYANGILEIRLRVSSANILKRFVAFPSNQEQQRIVNELNKRMTLLDALIANQEAQIEKLKAYKQSLITEVVTKGLDPNVPMKDSGVEWIGKIATKHQLYRLKFLLTAPMMYGANESGNKESENAVRYIRITDITTDSKLKDDENNLYLPLNVAKDYLLTDGDVLFARSGGTVGKSFIYRSEYGDSAFAGYLIKAECNTEMLMPEYLFYFTLSSLYEQWKSMIFIQATIQNIGANKYSNLEIVIPSIQEQKRIVEYLACVCQKIDTLVNIKSQKIDKLNEYKKSLIYEYVTGKKEVKA